MPFFLTLKNNFSSTHLIWNNQILKSLFLQSNVERINNIFHYINGPEWFRLWWKDYMDEIQPSWWDIVFKMWFMNYGMRGTQEEWERCLDRLLIWFEKLDKLVRNRITSLRRKEKNKHEKTIEIWFGRNWWRPKKNFFFYSEIL